MRFTERRSCRSQARAFFRLHEERGDVWHAVRREGPCTRDKINIHSIVYSDMQEVCGSNRLVTVLVLRFAGDQWGSIVY